MPLTEEKKASLVKALKRRRKQTKGTLNIEPPIPITVSYYRDLLKILTVTQAAVMKSIFSIVEKRQDEILDSLEEDTSKEVTKMIARLQALQETVAFEVAVKMAKRTNTFHRAEFRRVISKHLGVDIGAIMTDQGVKEAVLGSVERNVNLIKSIPKEHLERINKVITQGIRTGSNAFDIKKEIHEQFGISKRRSKVIARDQVSKLTNTLSSVRQQDIGVTHYVWRTSKDERVRPTHAKQEGKRYSWTKSPKPATGPPGEDIQCRCSSEPDLSTVLKGLDRPAKDMGTGAQFGTSEKAQIKIHQNLGPIRKERRSKSLKKKLAELKRKKNTELV
jgi:SPP1 gp7 family putative phage head morphogenesis protein